MLRRLRPSRRLVKLGLIALLAGFCVSAACVLAFLVSARGAQSDFQPVNESLPLEVDTLSVEIPAYRRAEDATYLTFVEWYLVFNPQEYAQFLAHDRPSRFPYFHGIAQIWRGDREVYGITRRFYPFNGGYNLMLVVIGVSSTAEFAIKGLYEKSVGRFFEWTASGERTAEDDFAAQVAREYGEFVPTQPWFEFPFGRKLKELWTTTGFTGAHFPRKCERKFFLSLEYGVKTLYAAVIRLEPLRLWRGRSRSLSVGAPGAAAIARAVRRAECAATRAGSMDPRRPTLPGFHRRRAIARPRWHRVRGDRGQR